MSISDVPSSPLRDDMSLEDQVAWYKSQYEQLETELAEFRVSSQELEAELEKDLEAAERRENALRSKADGLKYEVDEWKRKYKESKNEANVAQNTLEKEITTLRDTNRTLQHRLRDIEVANDDFERQARHTHSSLEDLEMKYNTAIEKAVMLEEEIKIGENERENLRIESQRLRQELADLKIEAEILQDKLKKQVPRHMSTVSTDLSIPGSPTFDSSVRSGASSPLIATPPESASLPPAKLLTSEPPSPPMSDASAPAVLPKARVPPIKTPVPGSKPRRSRLPSMDTSVTARPRLSSAASSRPPTRSATNSTIRPTPATRSSTSRPPQSRNPSNKGLAQSTSLSHIRSLTAQMQRLEARVHSARSKLPAPATTPPRASPRPSVVGSTNSFTARTRRRGTGSVSSVSTNATTPEEMTSLSLGLTRSSTTNNRHVPRLSNAGINRMVNGPLPNRGPTDSASEISRPSSRASTSSWARPVSRADGRYDSLVAPPRPGSRAGGAAYTPLGRPISRASFSSSFHGHTMSFSTAEEEEPEERERIYTTPSKTPNRTPSRAPSRRNTYSRQESGTGIPAPSGIPMPGSRRTSIASVSTDTHLRRPSISARLTKKPSIQFGDLGETY